MTFINKMAGARSSCGGFQVLHFKKTKGKGKFKTMLSFLFVDTRKLFVMKLSFEEFNLVFSTERFLKNLQAHSVLLVKKLKLLKGNFFVFIKFSWTFSTFWHRCERKTTKCTPIWNWFYVEFCHVLSQFNLGERIHDPVSVTRVAFKD